MVCFPPCNPFCTCVNGQCQPSATTINAIQLATLDGRFLAAGAPGASLRARAPGTAQTSRTFYLSPPTPWPLSDGDPLVMLGMDAAFAPVTNDYVRAQHSKLGFGGVRTGFNLFDWLFNRKNKLATYYMGARTAGCSYPRAFPPVILATQDSTRSR